MTARPSLGDPLEADFEERPVMNFEQPVGDVNAEIRVDPDELSVKGCMVELC
jgi:hypothetical protein